MTHFLALPALWQPHLQASEHFQAGLKPGHRAWTATRQVIMNIWVVSALDVVVSLLLASSSAPALFCYHCGRDDLVS